MGLGADQRLSARNASDHNDELGEVAAWRGARDLLGALRLEHELQITRLVRSVAPLSATAAGPPPRL